MTTLADDEQTLDIPHRLFLIKWPLSVGAFDMPLDIIGVGYGRTGTLSLKQALEILGYSDCYHMSEVVAHPEHSALWINAWKGDDSWEAIFDGYRATVDWPAVAFWPRLMNYYPKAKLILTTRDVESWYRSASNTIFKAMKEGMLSDEPARRERIEMAKDIIVDGTFGGDLDDKATVLAAYQQNIDRIYNEVPKERLIIFDSAEGWDPLCEALGTPIPKVPYPRINTTEEFEQRWRGGDPRRGLRST